MVSCSQAAKSSEEVTAQLESAVAAAAAAVEAAGGASSSGGLSNSRFILRVLSVFVRLSMHASFCA